eukprot:m.149455 g.149455  ORF g.149455 m.149455 type:complete len:635 (-) comp20633_c0_seq3:109-2013(-)
MSERFAAAARRCLEERNQWQARSWLACGLAHDRSNCALQTVSYTAYVQQRAWAKAGACLALLVQQTPPAEETRAIVKEMVDAQLPSRRADPRRTDLQCLFNSLEPDLQEALVQLCIDHSVGNSSFPYVVLQVKLFPRLLSSVGKELAQSMCAAQLSNEEQCIFALQLFPMLIDTTEATTALPHESVLSWTRQAAQYHLSQRQWAAVFQCFAHAASYFGLWSTQPSKTTNASKLALFVQRLAGSLAVSTVPVCRSMHADLVFLYWVWCGVEVQALAQSCYSACAADQRAFLLQVSFLKKKRSKRLKADDDRQQSQVFVEAPTLSFAQHKHGRELEQLYRRLNTAWKHFHLSEQTLPVRAQAWRIDPLWMHVLSLDCLLMQQQYKTAVDICRAVLREYAHHIPAAAAAVCFPRPVEEHLLAWQLNLQEACARIALGYIDDARGQLLSLIRSAQEHCDSTNRHSESSGGNGGGEESAAELPGALALVDCSAQCVFAQGIKLLLSCSDAVHDEATDDTLAAELVLLQHNWPQARARCTGIVESIVAKRSFTFPNFFRYIKTLDILEEFLYVLNHHGDAVRLDLLPAAQQPALDPRQRGTRSQQQAKEHLRAQFVEQVERIVDEQQDTAVALSRFLATF